MAFTDFSQYEPTYNKAIDMVASVVGHSRKTGRALKEIRLNRHFFELFFKGVELLQREHIDPLTPLIFDGVPVVPHDSVNGFDKMHPVYWNNTFNNSKIALA
jgi:hypothetical protein